MPRRSDLAALLSSSLIFFVGVALTSVVKLVERVFIARSFSLEAYGEVSIGLAILVMASQLSLVGLNQGVPRYVSRLEDERDVRGVWLTGLLVALGVAGVVTAVLYLNVGTIASILFSDAESPALLRLFVLAIPAVVGLRMGTSAIRGMENTRYTIYAKDLLYPGLRLVLLVGLVAAGVGVIAAGYAYVIAAVASLVATHLLVGRLFDLVGPVRLHPWRLVRFSAPLVGSAIMAVVLSRTDTLMLGYFGTSSQAGLYNAAYPLASSLVIFLSSLGYLYLPLSSRLDADDRRDELQEVYRMTTRWGFILTFPVFLLMTAFADDILAILFGAAFRPAAPALIVVAVGIFSNVAMGRCRETLYALGDTDTMPVADFGAVSLNVALNVALIPPLGILGASIASAVAVVIRNAIIYAALRLQFGITLFSPGLLKLYAAVPLLVAPPFVVLAQALSLSLLWLPVVGVAMALATLGAVFLAGLLEPEDVVAVELVEDAVGTRVPLVRRYIPSESL